MWLGGRREEGELREGGREVQGVQVRALHQNCPPRNVCFNDDCRCGRNLINISRRLSLVCNLSCGGLNTRRLAMDDHGPRPKGVQSVCVEREREGHCIWADKQRIRSEGGSGGGG